MQMLIYILAAGCCAAAGTDTFAVVLLVLAHYLACLVGNPSLKCSASMQTSSRVPLASAVLAGAPVQGDALPAEGYETRDDCLGRECAQCPALMLICSCYLVHDAPRCGSHAAVLNGLQADAVPVEAPS